ncbi:hypothetical protein GCK32_013472 [Trichostrongylus colubriformis]|uniref:Uncharacterized protein n=1 Tax=Trichostrongylus colubriformis TaxID=6319 RepID=A0AAN8J3F1_TRICO
MKQSLDEKCERVMKKVLRKRKGGCWWPDTEPKNEEAAVDCRDDPNTLPKVVVSSALSTIDDGEYIDVVGDSQDANRNRVKNKRLF